MLLGCEDAPKSLLAGTAVTLVLQLPCGTAVGRLLMTLLFSAIADRGRTESPHPHISETPLGRFIQSCSINPNIAHSGAVRTGDQLLFPSPQAHSRTENLVLCHRTIRMPRMTRRTSMRWAYCYRAGSWLDSKKIAYFAKKCRTS
jgi:hypothetical protein